MMSTVLPSDSLLTNPLFAFNGGFTPWENLESFFTSTHHKPNDHITKPNLSRYHAGFALGAESSNLSQYHVGFGLGSEGPNLSGYHAGFDLGLEIPNKKSSLDKPNLSRNYVDLESPNQQSPSFDELNLGLDHVCSDLGSESLNQNSPNYEEMSPDQDQPNQNSNSTLSSSSSGSDDPNRNQRRPNSGSCQDPDKPVEAVINSDERKRKRMISNRESARRSRMRKQRHLEILRNSANELKVQTRERSNHLRFMAHQIQLVRTENERLKAESVILQRKLMQLSQIWKLQQLQQQSSFLHHHASPPTAPSCGAMQLNNLNH